MHVRTVTASLLDRLLDDEDFDPSIPPGQTSEAKYIASVARDIEQLLNTRNVRRKIISDGEPKLVAPVSLVDSSVAMLGLPDFSALSLSNGKHRQALVDSVKTTIETFDRRLKDVQVVLPEDARASALLQFSIRARLELVGLAKDVGFEAWFQSTTLQFAVNPSATPSL
ncbi:MAG TPA: type VI secretion system baseplate subunit TssE [Luteibacter sp.]|uniref:type VI secretion system baseplate subunit TssE n=1 Tax=Luteibacter sp. TaxID=1886636 RepID=UPI002CB933A5|nr:type VI secretion system baseplate subunit TssE [Luteibacter sp.]HVI55653.1 type VI secretion system baseplate subunit TssE [Luteibacter sp.]